MPPEISALSGEYGLSYSLVNEWLEGNAAAEVLHRALAMARQAINCDESDAECHVNLSWALVNDRQFETAEYHIQRALELNESNPYCITGMAEWLMWTGKPDKAIEWFDRAKKLDASFNPTFWWRSLEVCLFCNRRYRESIAAFKRSPVLSWWVHAYLAAAAAHLGEIAQSAEHAARLAELHPEFSLRRFADLEPYMLAAGREHLVEGMHKASLPE